jgi:cobalt-zinc-cadmium efflux system protein
MPPLHGHHASRGHGFGNGCEGEPGEHDPPGGGRLGERARLLITLLVTVGLLAAEVAGGLLSHSLALLSDAGHMATDAGALLLSLVACTFASRPADARRTYGFRRLEVLSALVNGAALFIVAAYVLVEAYHRLRAPAPVRTTLMLAVAAVGLLGNLVGMWLLHGQRSLNVRGAYLHILTDTLSSVAVLAGGAVMWLCQGAYVVDPILGGLIGLTVLWGAYRLVRDAVHILLEAAPGHIDLGLLTADLRGVEGVVDVHDLHVWTIASGVHALSAHVVVPGKALEIAGASDAVLTRLKEVLLEKHAIAHSTVQIESEDYVHVGEVH